ncbi:aspartic proteinase nepenthesin-2-like [Panicum virgatum]|uniref:aspartic proteinase nepenthesin-2-like n=1 Tax=Panicum virgatum TaxID=38727 RepID=UPI0019D659C0|nr:aspartic proteinase nepenthesin-2-like [Panicum virgatum]
MRTRNTSRVVEWFLVVESSSFLEGASGLLSWNGSSSSSQQVKKIANFLKKHAWDIIQNVLSAAPGDQKEGHNNELDSKAADTVGPYIFSLSVGASVLQNITVCVLYYGLPASAGDQIRARGIGHLLRASLQEPDVPERDQPTVAEPADNCSYLVQYNDYINTTGYLATDTFTFGQTLVPDVVFGCSEASFGDFSGASGVLGFSRGDLSLVSQLQLSWFSYLLQFGDDAVPQTENSHSTAFLKSSVYPNLYFVRLTGIMINGRQLNGIPAGTFDLQEDGTGGVFLSTTVPVTCLEEAAYNVVKQAFVSRIKSETVDGSALGLDLCYSLESVDNMTVPKLTLVFDGTNAAMELKKHNYFFADTTTGLERLTILPSRGGSLLGSLLQTDTNMAYDLDGGQLLFETAFAPPPHLKVSLMVVVHLVAWVLLF